MKHVNNWKHIQDNFSQWWRCANERPLMRIISKKSGAVDDEIQEEPCSLRDAYMDGARRAQSMKRYCQSRTYHFDAFPSMCLDIGPGSLALYLGSEPVFTWDTVWYSRCIEDIGTHPKLSYNPENYWWQEHCRQLRAAKDLADGDFIINIPDIIENMDILAAMRGPQELCYDLMDHRNQVNNRLLEIEDAYFEYFDRLYDITKEEDGGCNFSCYCAWAPGPMAKLQCDFSAMMSPRDFKELVLPSLERQCNRLEYSLYHLDGKDAIRHLDAVLSMDKLNALQWIAGDGQPDAMNEMWYPIHDRVRSAGKAIWAEVHDGDAGDWIKSADMLLQRYGPNGLYFIFPGMDEPSAERILNYAEKRWDVTC